MYIQGPPGTGKSYTGEAIIDVLLANKAKANLGPIICICQTNHALDQLLEHLYVGKGIKRIVRLGSQSKSSVISELTLQKIMDGQPPILHEIIVNGKRSKTRRKAAGKVIEALAELEEADPVRRQEIVRMMPKLNQEFEYYAKKVDEGWSERKTNILRGYDIIGVTTSGLARFRDLLSGVMSKVVLCEEAGEVLESHILSALMPHTQHVILIGDHEQLRPTTNVYDFQIANPDGARFSFDISLFERLVKPLLPTDKRLPFDTLQVQRRMHPRIAQLIRSTLYPQLQDADNVKQYQELSGFKNRLFWFHHTKFEDASNTARTGEFSFSNRFEIEVVKTVLGQLNRQSAYNDGEIAVLTPYAGQLRLLKIHLGTTYDISMNELDTAELEKRNMMVNVGNTKGRRRIRVATVDNFQGEEASVVIISLVRSNAARKCGFLNQSNRINVLLSRAKHGMLIIGNSDTYSPNNMWWEILQMMYAQGNVGTYFELPCPRHNGKTIRASTAQQFTLGGCTEKCDKPLACGHPCAGSCHPKIEHDKFRCRNRCDVQLSCNHMCSQACHVDRACGSCTACDPVRESESQLSDRRLKPSHAVPSEIGMPIVRIARIEVVKAEVAASGSPLHVADSLLQLGAAISSPLINFISTSHRRLVELELALLDWQDALSDTTLSAEVLGQVERTGELKIEGGPKRMIQVVHEWLGGRYDSAVGFVADVNRYLRMVRTEQTRLEAMCNPSRHSKWPETVQHEDIVQPLRLQCTLSAVVLLIRCNIVILTDFFSLRRRLNTSKTTVSIDLTGLRRLCEFVIETAQKSRYPRHEAEAHMLMGKMVAISREATGSKLAADLEELVTAKAHLARALSIIIAYERLYYLIDETEAVIGELENSTFRNIVTSKQKRKDWQLYAQDFQVDDHWHVCAYGHPFSVKKETAGPCRECDAPVGEHVSGRASSRSDDDGNADSSADCDGGEDVFHGQHSRASSLI